MHHVPSDRLWRRDDNLHDKLGKGLDLASGKGLAGFSRSSIVLHTIQNCSVFAGSTEMFGQILINNDVH